MEKVALLICSCDYYSDCWMPMFLSLEKYWPDCVWDKILVSNHKDVSIPGVRVIRVGDHKGWASDTLKAVSLTDYDYYIYFQEDYWLNKSVNNEAIKQHIDHCRKNGIDYLKLQRDYPNRDSLRINGSEYCLNPMDRKYAINTATAIWSKSLFEKVLIPGFTGWDFEYKIIHYIKRNKIDIKSEVLYSPCISSMGISMIPANGVQRGKWTPAGVSFLKDNGFYDILSGRKTQNRFYSWCYYKLPEKGVLKLMKKVVLRILRWLNIN